MTMTWFPIFVFLAAILANAPPLHGSVEKANVLKLSLQMGAPSQGKLPLTEALGQLGAMVRGGYVQFGTEVILKDGREPSVRLEVTPNADLESALHALLAQTEGYEMEVVSDHLINIYPSRSKDDPADALNLRIATFRVAETRAGAILADPERFIPELKDRLTPKPAPGMHQLDLYVLALNLSGPLVSIQLRDINVREILNAVSKATEGSNPKDTPLGWAYLVEPSPNWSVPKHSWNLIHSLPSNWRIRHGSSAGPLK